MGGAVYVFRVRGPPLLVGLVHGVGQEPLGRAKPAKHVRFTRRCGQENNGPNHWKNFALQPIRAPVLVAALHDQRLGPGKDRPLVALHHALRTVHCDEFNDFVQDVFAFQRKPFLGAD